MLTLVAAVLAYDMAREMWEVRDARSSIVEAAEASPRVRRGAFGSRSDRSWTRLEKDMMSQLCAEIATIVDDYPVCDRWRTK